MANIKDVARLAGVSPITVSRIIHNGPYVRQETRERVVRAIEELNYIPSAVARSLKQARTGMIALLITDMTSSFLHDVAKGAAEAARRHGWSLLLGNSIDDPDIEASYLKRMGEHRIDGIVMMPTAGAGRRIRTNLPDHTPVVLLDRRLSDLPTDSVTCDTRTGVRKLTEHMLKLGHRHIALVGGSPTTATWIERVAGFRAAMDLPGLEQPVIIDGDYQEAGARQGAVAILKMQRLPDAIIAGNSQVAIAMLNELAAHAVRVPQDVAMASVDDPFPGSTFWPKMTHVEQPGYEMGCRAVDLLAQRVIDKSTQAAQTIVFEAVLRIGESCREERGLPERQPDPPAALRRRAPLLP